MGLESDRDGVPRERDRGRQLAVPADRDHLGAAVEPKPAANNAAVLRRCLALAAKLARIVWALLRHERSFDQGAVVAA